MAVGFEQSIINWILVGGVAAILYGLRYLVLMDRRLMDMESSLQLLVARMEQEERDILLEERLIEKSVLKKGKGAVVVKPKRR